MTKPQWGFCQLRIGLCLWPLDLTPWFDCEWQSQLNDGICTLYLNVHLLVTVSRKKILHGMVTVYTIKK